MGLLVQDFLNVKMVKYGMFILIVVNALIICIGQVKLVNKYLFVKEGE